MAKHHSVTRLSDLSGAPPQLATVQDLLGANPFHTGHEAGFTAGGGNAAIRPYQGHSPIRAAGIPTGNNGGYKKLDKNVRALVDDAIAHIRRLLATGNYDQVVFSYDPKNKTLGTGIFTVADEVKNYIYESICSLGYAE